MKIRNFFLVLLATAMLMTTSCTSVPDDSLSPEIDRLEQELNNLELLIQQRTTEVKNTSDILSESKVGMETWLNQVDDIKTELALFRSGYYNIKDGLMEYTEPYEDLLLESLTESHGFKGVTYDYSQIERDITSLGSVSLLVDKSFWKEDCGFVMFVSQDKNITRKDISGIIVPSVQEIPAETVTLFEQINEDSGDYRAAVLNFPEIEFNYDTKIIIIVFDYTTGKSTLCIIPHPETLRDI